MASSSSRKRESALGMRRQTESADQFASFDHDLGSLFGLGEVVGVAASVLLVVKRRKRFVETLLVYIPLAVCPARYPKNDVTLLIESHSKFPFPVLLSGY
jgi:hypothetical protein